MPTRASQQRVLRELWWACSFVCFFPFSLCADTRARAPTHTHTHVTHKHTNMNTHARTHTHTHTQKHTHTHTHTHTTTSTTTTGLLCATYIPAARAHHHIAHHNMHTHMGNQTHTHTPHTFTWHQHNHLPAHMLPLFSRISPLSISVSCPSQVRAPDHFSVVVALLVGRCACASACAR